MSDEPQNSFDVNRAALAGPVEGTDASGGAMWAWCWAAVIALAAGGTVLTPLVLGRSPEGAFVPAVVFMVCLLASQWDAATGRIPNAITYGAIVLGLFLNCWPVAMKVAGMGRAAAWLGASGPTQSVLGLVVYGGIGMACFFMAGMGGGDMKLLGAIGAMLGLGEASVVMLWALAVAVVYSLVNLVVVGRLNAVLRAAAVQLLNMVYLKQVGPVEAVTKWRIPLAVPLLAGVVLWRMVPVERLPGWIRG